MISISEFLARVPKIELHLHLEGSIRPETALALSVKNGVELPPFKEVKDLYRYETLEEFLAIYTAVSDSVLSADDYRRITYEMLQSCAGSNARYVEFFFSPQVHFPNGVSFDTQMDGITAGMADAERDFGIVSRAAPGVNRELGPAAGEELLDMFLARGDEKLIGIGLDFNEAPFPPEPYGPLFARARKAGLNVTAHAGETGPADFVRRSIDSLGVRRIDHGYHGLDDDDGWRRYGREGICCAACPSTGSVTSGWHDLRPPAHPVGRRRKSGLKVWSNTGVPPRFFPDLGGEYEKAAGPLGFSPADIRTSILTAIEGAWLDEETKKDWTASWAAEIDARIAELA